MCLIGSNDGLKFKERVLKIPASLSELFNQSVLFYGKNLTVFLLTVQMEALAV